MSDKQHIDSIHNSLDEGPASEKPIHVFVTEGGVRRNGLKNGNSEVKAGESEELVDIRGIGNIILTIRSQAVPNRTPGGSEGIKVHLPEKLNPHHVNMKRISGNEFELDFHFDKAIPNKEMATDIDPNVQHPD